MHTIHLYGIPHCDTVKKARAWLDDRGAVTVFHDFKKEGVPHNLLPQWLQAVGRDKLINRAGPTWRKLDESVKASVVDDASAIAVMLAHSSTIKRPVVVWPGGAVTVGFKPDWFEEHLL